MHRRSLLMFSYLMLVATVSVAQDGLVPIKSRQLDELLVSPSGNLGAYKKVLIEPTKAEVHPGWIRSMNDSVSMAGPRVKPADAARIAQESAKGLDAILRDTYKSRGYEIVTAPGPGVMRLTPSITEIFLNAPDKKEAGVASATEEAGTAKMHVIVKDSVSGAMLARSNHKVTAGNATGGPTQATSVSNRFWFGGAFQQWANNLAKELQAASAPKS